MTTIYSKSHTYNNIGSLLSSNINQNGTSLSKSYTYNNNDELISSTSNGDLTTYYNTPFSNFTSYTDSKDTVLFEYNDNHSLTKKTVNGIDTLYSYDNRGNRVSEVSKDVDLSYYYDSFNRLYKVIDNKNNYQTSYKYDALNNMISEDHINLSKSGNKIVNCGNNDLKDYHSYSSPSEYHNNYSHNPNTLYSLVDTINDNHNYFINNLISDSNNLFITNRLGSTVLSIDNNGLITTYDYSDYGILEDNDISIGYTGGLHINNDQIYLNSRIYDPTTFSFLNKDTIPLNINDQSSFNEYTYCRLNPLKYIDPSGNSILLALGIAAVAYAAGIVLGNKAVEDAKKKNQSSGTGSTNKSITTKETAITTNNTPSPGPYIPSGTTPNKPSYTPSYNNSGYNDIYTPSTTHYPLYIDTNPTPTHIDLSQQKLAEEVREINTKNVLDKVQSAKDIEDKQTNYDNKQKVDPSKDMDRGSSPCYDDNKDTLQPQSYDPFDYTKYVYGEQAYSGSDLYKYGWDAIYESLGGEPDEYKTECTTFIRGRSAAVNGFSDFAGNGNQQATNVVNARPNDFELLDTRDGSLNESSIIKRGAIISESYSEDTMNTYKWATYRGHVIFVEDCTYNDDGTIDDLIVSEGNVTSGSIRVQKIDYINSLLYNSTFSCIQIANPR